ncbi:MAG: DUF736 family protein [Alphaproteobacteria bacterium]|nr:DUF736 family protein [Alphaproteobacteria bacterium]
MKTSKRNNVKIGTFTLNQQGILEGHIYGLGLGSTPVVFAPQTSQSGNSYYRLIADPQNNAYEIGVAFPKEKNGNIYHSISIDSPALQTPINATLFADKNTGDHNLFWSRMENTAPKTEANNQPPARPATTALTPA